MIFLILNFVIACTFVFLTFYTDKRVQTKASEGNEFLIPLLIISVEAILNFITLLFRNMWFDTLVTLLLRIRLFIDGVFLSSFSMSLIFYAIKRKTKIMRFIIFLLSALAFVFVYFLCDKNVHFGSGYDIIVTTPQIFTGSAASVFPWNYYQLYLFVFQYFIPFVCYIFFVLLQEKSSSPVQRYQGLIIGLSIVVMWLLNIFLKFAGNADVSFESLYLISYVFMFIVIIMAIKKTTIPSGRSIFVNFLKSFLTYVLPAAIIGCSAMFFQPADAKINLWFCIIFGLISAVVIIAALMISSWFSSSTKMYTADYEHALERDLASIDYSTEMDEITNRMYEIFRKNVEASSVNVYILNNKSMLETAYSSNNLQLTLPVNTPVFDELLNINKSVVIYDEIGNKHEISAIEDELKEFFDKLKADAIFILNEGRNILGLITLGKKTSGDHYKEYDYNVFTKLYSNFFVFGYYMRNIANKEIISIVNREIKMSSQIITSIQENIDHPKTEKVDTGYLMVPAHNIGGEFIDMIRLTEKRHLFVVGDLSGKGIAASMNMVILKSVIRTYLAEIHDFKELVVKLNNFIRESFRKGTIFAGLFALIDFETDTMYYINCGIPALMLYTQVYNNVIEIQGSGHILGFVKDLSPFVSVKTTKLNKGDVILACTDGLVQSHSLRGEQFGKERIQQCILDNSTYPAQRMAQFTFESLTKFMQKEMEDDVSILVLKYGQSDFADNTASSETIQSQNDNDIPELDPALQEPDEYDIAKEFMDSKLEATGDEVVEPKPAEMPEEPVVEQSVEDVPAAGNSEAVPDINPEEFNIDKINPDDFNLDDMFLNENQN